MAQTWLLLLLMCFSVFQFGHSLVPGLLDTVGGILHNILPLKGTQSQKSACLNCISHNRKCFVASQQRKCHRDAREDCFSQGGRLAIPQDLAENNALRAYGKCSNLDCQSFWLGITVNVQKGIYVGVNGLPITFSNWMQGQGGHRRGQNGVCVSLSLVAQGKWHDDVCGNTRRYICEFPISRCASR